MTSHIFTGRVKPHTDVNGLTVMKAHMVIVRDGQLAEAERITKAFNSGAKGERIRAGIFAMDQEAITNRIEELKDKPEHRSTVDQYNKALISLVRHKAGLTVG
jgi:hypothetical protein